MSNVPNRPINVLSGDGAIAPAAADNYYIVTKASAAALTIAAPTVDGQRAVVQDGGGHAHVITTPIASPPTYGFNGTLSTLTFGGTKAQFVELISYNGSWYVLASSGITPS